MADPYDILIIGGGPGGYVAAIRAAQLGSKTAVVEREHLGGICLNWGCIPTKALLRSAEIFHYLNHAKDYGLKVDGKIGFDPAAVVKRSRAVSAQLNNGVAFLLKKNKVDVIWGEATITRPGEVLVAASKKPAMQPPNPAPKGVLGAATYAAKNIIVATGARPRVIPGIEPDGKHIWTYFEAMVPKRFSKSLIVMGTGAIGIEFASFYRTMGTNVTVVEILPRILPAEDVEIAAHARKRFEKQGMEILTSTKVTRVEKKSDGIVATIERSDGATRALEAERMISAVGVTGNVENLGLEALGVKIERGIIEADGFGRTNVPGIYAIGDVAGPPMLAHKAEHEGVVCVEAIKGHDPHPIEKTMIPGCTYC
ncbi:MAG: dihydrolipoyl dehydrogenase, partial [Methylocella sp.]